MNKTKTYEYGKYVRELRRDQKVGKGIIYWNGGDRHQGYFKKEKKEGKEFIIIAMAIDMMDYEHLIKGKLMKYSILIMEIDMKEILMMIKGRKRNNIYKNGNRYEGNYKNNKSEGKGIYYWNNGDRYEGDWKNRKINGKGIWL